MTYEWFAYHDNGNIWGDLQPSGYGDSIEAAIEDAINSCPDFIGSGSYFIEILDEDENTIETYYF
jgi:hypothetical protein